MELSLSNTQSPSHIGIGGQNLDTVEREIIRKQQQRREEEMMIYLNKRADDKAREGADDLQASQSTNTLTKSGASMKNLGSSFLALEEKMNRLERQLDSQIKQRDEDEDLYTRNRDLIRGKLGRHSPQKEEATAKYKRKADEDEEEEEEEQEIEEEEEEEGEDEEEDEEEEEENEEEEAEEGYKGSSGKKKTGRSVGFQDAFKKKEAQLRQENDRIELNRREFYQHTTDSPGDANYETFGASAKKKKDLIEGIYENEIDKLK